jgi:hypothetical protein
MDQQTIYQTLYTTIYGGGGLGGARGLELSWENLTVKSKRGEVSYYSRSLFVAPYIWKRCVCSKTFAVLCKAAFWL